MEQSVETRTAKHLWKMGKQLSTLCPAASRYYIFCLEQMLERNPQVLKLGKKKKALFCHHCGSMWLPDNHEVKHYPCPILNKKMKRLLKCQQDKPWTLTRKQKKCITTFKASRDRTIYTCQICKKPTVFRGTEKPSIPENLNDSALLAFNPQFIKTPKSKWKEVNAGLIITESEKSIKKLESRTTEINEKTLLTVDLKNVQTPQSLTKISMKKTMSPSLTSPGFKTPSSLVSTPDSQKKSSRKKKNRHSLLCEVLKQEQNINKSRGSLSSFLSSLNR